MSSDDDTPSINKDKKLHSPNIRHRFRFLKSHGKSHTKEGTININNFSKLYNINTENVDQALPEHNEDIESAVDALEETVFMDTSGNIEKRISNEDILEKVAQKIDNIDLGPDKVINIKEVAGEDLKKSFFAGDNKMKTVFAPVGFVDVRTANFKEDEKNIIPWIVLGIYFVLYAILHTYIPYLAGLLLGISLALIFGYIYLKLYTNITSLDPTVYNKHILNNNIMEIPAAKEYQPLTKYEGWVNEYPETYDPSTYHISQTQSVFLRLQGNLLRISHSKSKVPKRAMWNEHEIKAQFTSHRIYNLLDAKLSLLPDGLTKIRLWSKKYPICITLSNDQANFDPSILKMEMDDEKEEKEKQTEKRKSPKLKKKFIFKKKEYPYMAQRFSKLSEDQDMDLDLDSDSRASTPSSEPPESNPEEVFQLQKQDDKNEDDDMHSIQDDWSASSRNGSPVEIKLYIFGRTDREKEDWFRRLAAATHHHDEISVDETDNPKGNINLLEDAKTQLEYIKYMTFFNKLNVKKIRDEKSAIEKQNSADKEDPKTESQLWLNTFIGRILFDCMRNPDFTKKVQNRIQKKLQTIKLPYFIEEITITELNLGKTPVFILNNEKPVLDERGLWVDLDVNYEGLVVLTLQTKLNLMKLKNPPGNDKTLETIKSAIYHSDVDDSAESSSDEDGPQEIPLDKESGNPPPAHGSKKFIKMVDKLTESKFFQAATENRYIKKAMEGVSNTELRLTVEIKAVSGTLVLNIPTPPSDRVWVGFRPVPEIILTAKPIVGDRNVTYAMVTSWIEKKLFQEFQKVVVIPNMEDFLVPVMNPKLPD